MKYELHEFTYNLETYLGNFEVSKNGVDLTALFQGEDEVPYNGKLFYDIEKHLANEFKDLINWLDYTEPIEVVNASTFRIGH